MFRKKIINASNNLKRNLHLETKIKSNGCLGIGSEEGVHRFLYSKAYGEFDPHSHKAHAMWFIPQ